MNKNNYVAIMAGGIGSRFWPVSRTAFPKQFLDILNSGQTLLQSTYERFGQFIPNENIFVITSDEYAGIVKDQLPNLPGVNIIGEPQRKNTAPCVALISHKLIKMNPDANIIVAPSDHLIEDNEQFMHDCLDALSYAALHDAFVTLGIKPAYANTGYGYIQYANQHQSGGSYPVQQFTEKPDKERAIQFLREGNYLWNSGIFIWKAADIIRAFSIYQPDMHKLFADSEQHLNTLTEKTAVHEIYNQCASISIDYAILEKANNVRVIPASFGWSDLGTWNSAWENTSKDNTENAIAGSNTLMVEANGCIVHSTDKKLVVVGGVEGLIIVNTPDALMICRRENEQQIKDYLLKVKETTGELYL